VLHSAATQYTVNVFFYSILAHIPVSPLTSITGLFYTLFRLNSLSILTRRTDCRRALAMTCLGANTTRDAARRPWTPRRPQCW